MYETQTTVVGTLITQVDKRTLVNGRIKATFRVASNERRHDRATDEWRDGDTLYISVTCWRRLAENVHASLSVGDSIVVHGRLFTRSWERDGRSHSVMEVDASAVGPDLRRATAVVTRQRRSEGSSARDSAVVVAQAAGTATEPGADPWAPQPALQEVAVGT